MARTPTALDTLTACGWETASGSRETIAAVAGEARAAHPDAAIVDSCQRIEAYRLGDCDCAAPRRWQGREALAHLAEVAAGLHSVVLGETQILGQCRSAFEAASGPARDAAGIAIAAARDLRAETEFNSHAGHLLDRGLAAAGLRPEGRLLVLGTGAMGRLVAERGIALGFDEVLLAGRREPAANAGWRYVPLTRIGRVGPVAVVAGCLGSGAGERDLDALPPAKLVIDLGTPRNFAGARANLITISGLLAAEQGQRHGERRRAALRSRLGDLLDGRLRHHERTASSPLGALRLEVERVRRRELERLGALHPEIAPETLDALTRSLVNQIFHAPTERLRTLDDRKLAGKLAALFQTESGREPAPA